MVDYKRLAKLSAKARGAYEWNQKVEVVLFDIVQDPNNYWGNGSHAPGMPNWSKIAHCLSLKLGGHFTNRQAQEKYWDILIRIDYDFPYLIQKYNGEYYIPEDRVDWKSIMNIIQSLITDKNLCYLEGLNKGRPNWNLVLLELQKKGYLKEFDLEDSRTIQSLAKQASKAYNKARAESII